MDAKTILIVGGLIIVLYLQGCFGGVQAQQPSAPAMDPAECYAQINAAVRDDWKLMTKVERFTVGMRAISICEGGN
jgi:hypothetical protein